MSKIVRKKDVIEAVQFFDEGELWPAQVYTIGGIHYVSIDGVDTEVFEGAWVVKDNETILMLTPEEYAETYEVV